MNSLNKVLDGIAGWLGKRVNLMLIILMLQIGMFVGFMSVRCASVSKLGAAEGTRAAVHHDCGPWLIAYAPSATLGDIRRWMINFNASVVAGPNETGAFELVVPGQTLDSIREGLDGLAESVQINAQCAPGR
jgi:hypothetical protein